MSLPAQKARAKRRTKLGLALEESAREILAHVKGEKTFPTRRIALPKEVDMKRIRGQAGMSQVCARALH
jgi:hypothetical protein